MIWALAGSFVLGGGGKYSDTVERYSGVKAGATFQAESSRVVAARATVRDCAEVSDSFPLSSSSEMVFSSTFTGVDDGTTAGLGEFPKIWLPKANGLEDAEAGDVGTYD